MTLPHEHSSGSQPPAPDAGDQIVEEVDAVPVLAEAAPPAARGARDIARARGLAGASLPAVQAAAVAAGSFVAGAAVAGLVHRRQRSLAPSQGGRVGRALARGSRKGARGQERLQIVGSRTLLVDVHLLGTPGAER